MATSSTPLLETLAKKRKKNRDGILTRDAEGQLRERSISGAAPLTPLGAKLQGVTSPDVAKMVGDARQKRAALQQEGAFGAQLSTQLRQRQAGRGMEAPTQEERDRANRIEKFGADVGNRVNTLVETKLAEADIGDASQYLKVKEGLTPEVTSALTAWQADPTNVDLLKAAAVALGLDLSTDQKTLTDQVRSNFTTDIGAAVAASFGDIDIENVLTEMGYDAAALGELGITGPINTLEDLEKELDRIEAEEYSQVANTQAQIMDPAASENEKSEALQTLRDMGAVGVRDIERQMDNIQEAFEAGTQIEFGGKSYDVEEFFSDEGVTELARQFFSNPDTQALLEKEEPAFAAFLKNNQAVLEGALANIVPEETAKELVDTQLENSEIRGEFNTIFAEVDEETKNQIMDALIPGFSQGGWSTEGLDTSAVADFLSVLNAPTPDNSAPLAGQLAELVKTRPSYARELMKLDKAQWKNLGFPTPGGDLNTMMDNLYKRQKASRVWREAAKTPESAKNYILSRMPKNMSWDSLKQLAYATKNTRLLEALKDPQAYLKKYNNTVTIEDFANSKGDASWPVELQIFGSRAKQQPDEALRRQMALIDPKTGKYDTKKLGKLSASESWELAKTIEDPDLRSKLMKKVETERKQWFSLNLSMQNFGSDRAGTESKIKYLEDLLDKYPKSTFQVDRDRIKAELNTTRGLLRTLSDPKETPRPKNIFDQY